MTRPAKVRVEAPTGALLPIRAKMPGEGLPFWKRLIIAPAETVYLVLLSDQIWTYYCHCLRKTYIPCFSDDGMRCPYCGPNGVRRVYQGSAPVAVSGSSKVWLWNPTKNALQGCPELVQREDLAGAYVKARRHEGGTNAVMTAEILPRKREIIHVSKRIDLAELQKVQCNLWGVELVRPGPAERSDHGDLGSV